jgi:hypothetical protein
MVDPCTVRPMGSTVARRAAIPSQMSLQPCEGDQDYIQLHKTAEQLSCKLNLHIPYNSSDTHLQPPEGSKFPSSALRGIRTAAWHAVALSQCSHLDIKFQNLSVVKPQFNSSVPIQYQWICMQSIQWGPPTTVSTFFGGIRTRSWGLQHVQSFYKTLALICLMCVHTNSMVWVREQETSYSGLFINIFV